MKLADAFPSRFLKSADVEDAGGVLPFTISRVIEEEIQGDGGKQKKAVAYFRGAEKRGVILNKTNFSILAAAYGDESDDWNGKPIELTTEQVLFAGKFVAGIRVRIPRQQKPAAPAKQPVPSPVSEEPVFKAEDVPF